MPATFSVPLRRCPAAPNCWLTPSAGEGRRCTRRSPAAPGAMSSRCPPTAGSTPTSARRSRCGSATPSPPAANPRRVRRRPYSTACAQRPEADPPHPRHERLPVASRRQNHLGCTCRHHDLPPGPARRGPAQADTRARQLRGTGLAHPRVLCESLPKAAACHAPPRQHDAPRAERPPTPRRRLRPAVAGLPVGTRPGRGEP